MILVADVLKAVSDNRSLKLFRMVALAKIDTDLLISKTKLTRRQYYSRMCSLMKAGLIIRKKGNYTLTAFGRVIYYTSLMPIENAIKYYWKLNVIDSLEMSNDLTLEEHKKIIGSLIDNQEIKTALVLYDNKFEPTSYVCAGQQQQAQLTPGVNSYIKRDNIL
jgi:hypothetical protein